MVSVTIQYYTHGVIELATGSSAVGQRICFSSNTTQYSVSNTTVRIHPNHTNHRGDYCTNIPLNVSQACARNGSTGFELRTIMHFNMGHVLNTSGVIEVNLTRTDGALRVSFIIQYSKCTIY